MDKWLNDIHDRLRDYEQEAPRGLWESLRARLDREGLPGKARGKSPAWTIWPRRIAVAACIAVAALVGYRHMTAPGQLASSPQPEAQESAGMRARAPRPPQPHSAEASPQATAITQSTRHEGSRVPVLAEATIKASPAASAHVASADVAVECTGDGMTRSSRAGQVGEDSRQRPLAQGSTSASTDMVASLPRHGIPPSTSHDTRQADSRSPQQPSFRNTLLPHTRLTLAAYTMGMGNSESLARGTGGSPLTALGPDAAAWNDSPQLALAVFNQGKATERKVRHHVPVHVGVSLSYDLTSHLALGSGLTYTHLRSDLREGTEANYQRSEQSLHYVGLPVNVRYTFLRRQGLSLYAQAGMLAEVRVAGHLATRYTLDGRTGDQETSRIGSHPLQMSAGAALGAQFHLTPALALYAEPGIGHYFKDNSSVPTIYEDKPTSLTLNVGLRLCLGR